MADAEFEEFRQYFEALPQHISSSAQNYRLVHDVVFDEEASLNLSNYQYSNKVLTEDDDESFEISNENESLTFSPKRQIFSNIKITNNERRRRKLTDSPKKQISYESKDEKEYQSLQFDNQIYSKHDISGHQSSSLPYIRDTVYSSDSELCDSGNSTAHSPEDGNLPGVPIGSMNSSFIQFELLEATHRALHKFIARHSDELELDVGDPIYVQKEADDLWCEGINLRNGNRGIFPSAYVVDVDYNDFDPSMQQSKRERFLLSYLGSVETLCHKGNSVLCQAVRKIISTKQIDYHSCILEVSDHGLRMYNKLNPTKDTIPPLDYFYSLKNVSFCGFYPNDSRFMGFITKHPHCDRFACHVFHSNDTTRPITESIGRAFNRFYQKYVETAYPVEDIYIE
ncbi:JNK-interacting protein 1 [Planococcus citri]|uniref:JNK-interacting protein 1 n=1 Tax=Planococcus citri TaxID=170843 RepID=UPI0031F89EEB